MTDYTIKAILGLPNSPAPTNNFTGKREILADNSRNVERHRNFNRGRCYANGNDKVNVICDLNEHQSMTKSGSQERNVQDFGYKVAEGANEKPNDKKDLHQNQYTLTESGIGTASTSALESQLQPNQENTSPVVEPSSTVGATASLSLNKRNPERVSEIIPTLEPNKLNHTCEECKAGFITPGALKRHMFIHTRKFPFVCSVCGKGFPAKLRLKSHEYIHSKEKPFKCEICSSAYTTEGALKAHVRRKHGSSGISINEEPTKYENIVSKITLVTWEHQRSSIFKQTEEDRVSNGPANDGHIKACNQEINHLAPAFFNFRFLPKPSNINTIGNESAFRSYNYANGLPQL
ncbi:hypothetical protein ACTXT7_005469 [Hymenolepis weldensis]